MSGMIRRVFLLVAGVAFAATTARAQESPDTAKTMAPSAWVSVALGSGTNDYFSGGLSGVASAWYAPGSLAFGLRTGSTDTGGIFSSTSDPVEDVAALVGIRSGQRRVFALFALGYAQVKHPDGSTTFEKRTTSSALAYSIQLSANYRYVGLVGEMFGAQGSGYATHRGVVFGVQLGWFGR